MAKGKTLWEMLTEKLGGGPVEFKFYKPLQARVGDGVLLNEVEWRDLNFFVREIREYRRTISGRDFFFVDYVLRAKPLNADEILVRLRLNPVDDPDRYAGLTHHTLLLRLDDEFAHNEEFFKVVTDNTGKFQILQDGEVKEEFTRINDLTAAYKARVSILQDANKDARVDRDEVGKQRLEYWDYWREANPGGQSIKEYLFVEMDADTGWFQIWRGQEIDPQRVMVL
jgi:hypothetical protein